MTSNRDLNNNNGADLDEDGLDPMINVKYRQYKKMSNGERTPHKR